MATASHNLKLDLTRVQPIWPFKGPDWLIKPDGLTVDYSDDVDDFRIYVEHVEPVKGWPPYDVVCHLTDEDEMWGQWVLARRSS